MSTSNKQKLLIIVGPTASGKTSLAIELAQQYNGEIISADSRQVYRGLDIGTGKVTHEEMEDVPHHLIDIAEPTEIYTVTDFKRDAENAIEGIASRNNLPIIAGGTFFYIDVLLGRMNAVNVSPNEELRAKLATEDTETLFEKLKKTDQRRAETIDSKNRRRLIRALEIINAIGTVPEQNEKECPYNVLTTGFDISKEKLRTNFHERAVTWLEEGLQKEVETLLKKGLTKERLSEIGFEYELILELIDEKINEEQYLQKFIEKNWQYAQRQMTYLRKWENVQWFESNQTEKIKNAVSKWLEG